MQIQFHQVVKKFVGIRPGEKLHEQMIGIEDAPYTYEYKDFYKILPQINNWDQDLKRIKDGVKVPNNFVYSSDTNSCWMDKLELIDWIKNNLNNNDSMIPYGKQNISKEDIDSVLSILKSDWITQGPNVQKFEKAIADKLGSTYCVAG